MQNCILFLVKVAARIIASLEREVAVDLLPLKFAERAGVQITATEARGILERMGHALPSQIRGPAGVISRWELHLASHKKRSACLFKKHN